MRSVQFIRRTCFLTYVQTPFDAGLAGLVRRHVEALQKLAAKDDTLSSFLCTCFPARDRLQSLFSHLQPESHAIAVAAKVISDGAEKVDEGNALLAAFFMEKHLKIADPIPAAPTGSSVRRASDHLTGDATHRDKRIVVAEQVGRGTLLSTRCGAGLPDSTDGNSIVSRGELLVVLPMVK